MKLHAYPVVLFCLKCWWSLPLWYKDDSVGSSYYTSKLELVTEDTQANPECMPLMKWISNTFLSVIVPLLEGTEVAEVGGWWLPATKRQGMTLNNDQMAWKTHPKNPKGLHMLPYIIPFPQHKQNNSDVIKWCHDHLLPLLGWESSVHVQSNLTDSPAHLPASPPCFFSIMHEPYSEFHIPLSVPVTCICIYTCLCVCMCKIPTWGWTGIILC